MKGFLRWTVHCTAGFFVLAVLGVVIFPFLFLAPFCLVSIAFYPLFKELLPEYMERRGY